MAPQIAPGGCCISHSSHRCILNKIWGWHRPQATGNTDKITLVPGLDVGWWNCTLGSDGQCPLDDKGKEQERAKGDEEGRGHQDKHGLKCDVWAKEEDDCNGTWLPHLQLCKGSLLHFPCCQNWVFIIKAKWLCQEIKIFKLYPLNIKLIDS